MRKRVLDTSRLVQHWRRRPAPRRRQPGIGPAAWAKRLIEFRNCQLILTPVALEFVAGARSAMELQLFREFLEEFHIADDGRVLDLDWAEARRIAERVPRDGKPRQLGDCLIRAISNRLGFEVDSVDASFPR